MTSTALKNSETSRLLAYSSVCGDNATAAARLDIETPAARTPAQTGSLTVKRIATLCLLICLAATTWGVLAQDPTTRPAPTAPADAGATTRPAERPELVAKVGDMEITLSELVRRGMAGQPDYQPVQLPDFEKALNNAVIEALLVSYVKDNVPAGPENAEAAMESLAFEARRWNVSPERLKEAADLGDGQLALQGRFKRMITQATGQEKVDAFVRDHPAYFNGTTVAASHILLQSDLLDPTEKQKKVKRKLERLATALKEGETTFEQAARKYSQDPGSAPRGGGLGSFTYDQMVPAFSTAAFATKPGEMSEIVRTEYGFHLIKVTGRQPGTAAPGPRADQVAKRVLLARLQARMFERALTTHPIVIFDSE